MSNYNSLKATINANIRTNGNQEITGSVMNSVLTAMVNTLGAGFLYAGVATPSTNPGSPDTKVFYFAATAGTYTNFGGLVLADGESAILRWDSSWHKDDTGLVSQSGASAIDQEIKRLILNTNGSLSGIFGVNGYRKKSDGSFVDSANFMIFTFPVKAGVAASLYAKVDSDVSAIAFSADGVSWSSMVAGLGATSFRTYTYRATQDGFFAVSCRKDSGTTLSIDDSLAKRIEDLGNKTPFYPSAGELINGTGYRIKFSDGSVITDDTYQFFKIPVVAGARVFFSAYCQVSDAAAAISFSADGNSWTPLVETSNDNRFAEYFAGISENGFVGLCHKKSAGFEPYLKIDYKTPSDYKELYNYCVPVKEQNRGIYTVSTRYLFTYSNTARILVQGIFVEPGKPFSILVEGIPNLAIMNAGYLNNATFVQKDTSLSLSGGYIKGTMISNANELVFTIKKSSGAAFTDAEFASLSLKVIRNPEDVQRDQAMAAFMDAMNKKAAHIGLTSSTFNNCYGGSEGGYNSSCVQDMLKLGIFACGFPKLCDLWSTKSESVQIYGIHARSVTITSNAQDLMGEYYADMHPGQTNPYYLLGYKGGGWSSTPKAYSCIGMTEINGKYVIGVAATTQGDGTTGREARIKGLIELFDIASAYIAGQSISGMSVTNVENAIVAILPEYPNARKTQTPDIIYSQNPTAQYNPASTTKVLAMLTMIDIIGNYEETHSIISAELINDSSSYVALADDVETINTSLIAMMVGSNAANTLSLARLCGEKIIASRNKFV